MPPVTTYASILSNSPKVLARQKPEEKSPTEKCSPNQKRKVKGSPKLHSRQSPKNNRKKASIPQKKEIPSITYDRDALLSIRKSPLCSVKPELPEIPGVTVPKTKKSKEIPLSLKLKLLKRGVQIQETNKDSSKEEALINKQTDVLRKLSLNEQTWHDCEDVMWYTCAQHVI